MDEKNKSMDEEVDAALNFLLVHVIFMMAACLPAGAPPSCVTDT